MDRGKYVLRPYLSQLRHFSLHAQEVTGRRFPADCSYRAGLEDGILLCE